MPVPFNREVRALSPSTTEGRLQGMALLIFFLPSVFQQKINEMKLRDEIYLPFLQGREK